MTWSTDQALPDLLPRKSLKWFDQLSDGAGEPSMYASVVSSRAWPTTRWMSFSVKSFPGLAGELRDEQGPPSRMAAAALEAGIDVELAERDGQRVDLLVPDLALAVGHREPVRLRLLAAEDVNRALDLAVDRHLATLAVPWWHWVGCGSSRRRRPLGRITSKTWRPEISQTRRPEPNESRTFKRSALGDRLLRSMKDISVLNCSSSSVFASPARAGCFGIREKHVGGDAGIACQRGERDCVIKHRAPPDPSGVASLPTLALRTKPPSETSIGFTGSSSRLSRFHTASRSASGVADPERLDCRANLGRIGSSRVWPEFGATDEDPLRGHWPHGSNRSEIRSRAISLARRPPRKRRAILNLMASATHRRLRINNLFLPSW